MSRIIDLTLPFDERIAGFQRLPAKSLLQDGWNASQLHIYSHAGTHMDAPWHFEASETYIDELPLEKLLNVRAWVADLRGIAAAAMIEVEHLQDLIHKIQQGDSLLLCTNWSKKLGTAEYRNALPRLSPTFAQWCVQKQINILGVEPPSVADVNNLEEVTLIHQILLKGGVTIVEGLCNLDLIQHQPVLLTALPLKIKKGDGSPARVLAIETATTPEEPMPSQSHTVVVLDDDPTGTQTVHQIPVLTDWSLPTLKAEFEANSPVFYILTNTRAKTPAEAASINAAIAQNLLATAQSYPKSLVIISRSDSTLRGHFPLETDVLAAHLFPQQDYFVALIPAFFEGQRFTKEDVHYLYEKETWVPVSQTPYAADRTFGYQHSNLKSWVSEKSHGRIPADQVHSISIDLLEAQDISLVIEQIRQVPPGGVLVVNALNYQHLISFSKAALASGRQILYRSAASFVAAFCGIVPQGLLLKNAFAALPAGPGLIVVGSHVPKSTAQLTHLLASGIDSLELKVAQILVDEAQSYLLECARKLNALLKKGDTVVYTSRIVHEGHDEASSLQMSICVSDFICKLIGKIKLRPRYILAKGGITSSDLATNTLRVKRAMVLGQILPGVPLWQLGAESRFPGLPYIVFPGNVGNPEDLQLIRQFFNPSETDENAIA